MGVYYFFILIKRTKDLYPHGDLLQSESLVDHELFLKDPDRVLVVRKALLLLLLLVRGVSVMNRRAIDGTVVLVLLLLWVAVVLLIYLVLLAMMVLEFLLWDRWLEMQLVIMQPPRLEVLQLLAFLIRRPSTPKLHKDHGLCLVVRVLPFLAVNIALLVVGHGIDYRRSCIIMALDIVFVIIEEGIVRGITVGIKLLVLGLDLGVSPVEVHHLADFGPLAREAEASCGEVEGFAFVLGPGLGVDYYYS